jgi:hypothetical protein
MLHMGNKFCAFYELLTVHLGSVLGKNQLDTQFFFIYIYYNSLHVSRTPVPIIRRINCINMISAIYVGVGMSVPSKPAHLTVTSIEWHIADIVLMQLILLKMRIGVLETWYVSSIQTCTLDGHLHRVTYTRYRINAIDSPDDVHRGARNMYRIGINIYEKRIACVKLVIYKNWTEMHGQQNTKSQILLLHQTGYIG